MMTGFEQYTRKTRRAIFLEEMEQVVPWRELGALVEPHYPKPGNGRRAVGGRSFSVPRQKMPEGRDHHQAQRPRASIGAAAGGKLESSMTEGLPEDELFVYEDALRKGRSVVIAPADDEAAASRLRELLEAEGAEAVDTAREQWWIGLRDAEHEHYSTLGRNFGDDEKFYRLGFESALHARTRCKEYDQVLGEMTAEIEELERRYPGAEVAAPFTRGYERGRDYYQQLCK
jgi:hypothetical protein